MSVAYSASHGLGEEQSIWFKLTPLLAQENPMQVLQRLAEKYGGAIPINLKNQRVMLLSDVDHFKRVLVENADNYPKYFDGMRPVFGKTNSNMVAASNTATIFGSNADVKASPLSSDGNAMTSNQFASVVTTGGRRRR